MDMTDIRLPSPRELAAEFGLRQRRRMGQRFLTNHTTLDKIVRAADLTPQTAVVEIGAGPGYLTARIRQKAERVIAIEIDERFRAVHERCFAGLVPPVEFVYADALRVDWDAFLSQIGARLYVVMGNIPYQITSPLLRVLAGLSPQPQRIVLLVQREFAQRLAAKPGGRAYGALTAKTALIASARQVLFVPRHCFQPRPRVDSAVILIEPRRPPLVGPADQARVFALIEASFAQRRKKIVNSLLGSGHLGEDRERILEWLKSADINPARRPETVTPEEYVRLAEAVGRASPCI